MLLWRTIENYLLIITRYPPYLFYWTQLEHSKSYKMMCILWSLGSLITVFIFHAPANTDRTTQAHLPLPWVHASFCKLCCAKFGESQTLMSQSTTKPTKWPVCPAKTQISLGICPVWSVFTVRLKKTNVCSYSSSTQRRLIRLHGCVGWSESLLGAHIILLVLSCCSSFMRWIKTSMSIC